MRVLPSRRAALTGPAPILLPGPVAPPMTDPLTAFLIVWSIVAFPLGVWFGRTGLPWLVDRFAADR